MRPCVELYYSSSTQHIDGSPRLYFEPFIWCLSSFANALPWEAGTTSIERTTLLLHSLDEGLSMIAHTRSPIVIASPKHKWMSGIQNEAGNIFFFCCWWRRWIETLTIERERDRQTERERIRESIPSYNS